MVGGVRRSLKVFLCHASGDKPPVREFYKRLISEGVDAWLDQEKLLPGQDWRVEIPRAVEEADVVIVFLSQKSITKEGYVQKEIKFALDIAEEKPEGTIFLIPARIEECAVPERLCRWQWVDLYEENGYAKLLRSLKLRADRVGAVIETASYLDTDQERERRLDQLYTEGLAAFYTEEWEKACQRFRAILNEQPNHPGAREKLEEAERQRTLSDLYTRSLDAHKAENWPIAIKLLEELLQKSAEYRDASQLLRNAKKQRQLRGLYAEAKTLHASQKWQAVLKVFEQLSSIESAYPDPENLLETARKEMAELNRIAELNDLYSHAVREIDARQWAAARNLLEKIHKTQTGFQETERLLRKVDTEIQRLEEDQRRNDQVNTLYEQAHGLMRAKKWRKVLEKIEEIRELDGQFVDKDAIFGKAKSELERDEGETQRQNELAAMYAEAVRLLKEEKYQEALDKWQEVKRIDPKYPDRQWVQRTARRKSIEIAQPVRIRSPLVMPKSLWIWTAGLVVIVVAVAGVILSGKGRQNALPTSISAPTGSVLVNPTAPTISDRTSMPGPVTPLPMTSGYPDPTMYDDFDIQEYDGKYNAPKWGLYTDPNSEEQNNGYVINQLNGQLAIGVINGKGNLSLGLDIQKTTQPIFVEARLYLDPATTDNGTNFYFQLNGAGQTACGIFSVDGKPNRQEIKCWSEYYDKGLELNTGKDNIEAGWHILRLETSSDPFEITSFIDGLAIGKFSPQESAPGHYDEIRISNFSAGFGLHNFGSAKSPVGYIDYVRMGAIADDPTVYDNFSNVAYDGKFNTTQWAFEQHDLDGSAIQQDGVLVFTQSGIEKGQILRAIEYWPLELQRSLVFEANLKSEMTNDGFVVLQLTGDVNASCGLHSMSDVVMAHCWNRAPDNFAVPVAHRTWHTVRIEVNVENNLITFFMDGKKLTEDHYDQTLRGASVYMDIHARVGRERVDNTRPMIGYVDDVRVLPLEYIGP